MIVVIRQPFCSTCEKNRADKGFRTCTDCRLRSKKLDEDRRKQFKEQGLNHKGQPIQGTGWRKK